MSGDGSAARDGALEQLEQAVAQVDDVNAEFRLYLARRRLVLESLQRRIRTEWKEQEPDEMETTAPTTDPVHAAARKLLAATLQMCAGMDKERRKLEESLPAGRRIPIGATERAMRDACAELTNALAVTRSVLLSSSGVPMVREERSEPK